MALQPPPRKTSLTTHALLFALLQSGSPALASEPVLQVGQPPPAIALSDLRGAAVSLEALGGQVVLVDFWASWCVPCREELPLLEALQARHAEQGLKVLAINVDEREKDRGKYLDRHPLALTVLDDSAQAAVAAYQVQKMPTSVLIDRQGLVAAVHYGFTSEDFAELETQVASLVQTAAPAAPDAQP